MQHKSLAYAQLINEFAQRKFTHNDIKSFVHRVFSMYERATVGNPRIPAEAFTDLVDEQVEVQFPDRTIQNRAEFLDWHRWIHGRLRSDDHDISNIQVENLCDGRYQARFQVRWRAEFLDGQYTDLKLEQRWVMREEDDLDHPVIETYQAAIADTLPGSTASEAERR
ncbi:hypothetical protein [Ferrimonas marina]|uniref:SnoaL-like domain-containing protein n=1 Tax=Ferrimonas marina TaxID=299255 RepID=A0A1M5MSL3_9GAMM|nr:hypothetical protein [Ferrimonas marina]SHG80216.1 hypothetical protein SAMN02745129_0760 [Ferrimonas marina]